MVPMHRIITCVFVVGFLSVLDRPGAKACFFVPAGICAHYRFMVLVYYCVHFVSITVIWLS